MYLSYLDLDLNALGSVLVWTSHVENMGSGISQEQAALIPAEIFNVSQTHLPFMLPDVGIHESLLKFSGSNSNSELKGSSDELIKKLPGNLLKLRQALPSSKVSDAVGLGALVISMIMEICTSDSRQTSEDSFSLLQNVFGQEKASAVRNTMLEYLKRHRMFINNEQRLKEAAAEPRPHHP